MADRASNKLFVSDLLQLLNAYKAHLVPRRTSGLGNLITTASSALGTAFGGPAGGSAAGALSGFLVAPSSRFRPYRSPITSARIKRDFQKDLIIATLRRQLLALQPVRPGGFK